jgi:hypothetical protein
LTKKRPNRSPPDHAAGSGTSNPLDRTEALLQSTGDHRLVQWICQHAGGFFILNPKNTPHPHFLIPATNQIVQEFADLLAVIATTAADSQITQTESKQIRARWEELKTVTESFVWRAASREILARSKTQPPNARRRISSEIGNHSGPVAINGQADPAALRNRRSSFAWRGSMA